jgi:hypothetical protein
MLRKKQLVAGESEKKFVEPRQRISNEHLDTQVLDIIDGQPRWGADTIAAAVAVAGFHAPRQSCLVGNLLK